MANEAQPPQILAADTNVPLDMALGRELVLDAVATVRRRIPNHFILVPPTVAGELVVLADEDPSTEKRAAAARFFAEHRAWGFRLISVVPLGDEFIHQVAATLRHHGLIDEAELNDSLLLVEAAALDCSLLLTSDEHLRTVDYEQLVLELRCFDLTAPVITTPREIVNKFFS